MIKRSLSLLLIVSLLLPHGVQAMEPNEEGRSNICTRLFGYGKKHPSPHPEPIAVGVPPKASRLNKAAEVARSFFHFFVFAKEDSSQAPSVKTTKKQAQQIVREGVKHLAVGAAALYLSSNPSDEERLTENLWGKPLVRTLGYSYGVSHCLEGVQLLFGPQLKKRAQKIVEKIPERISNIGKKALSLYEPTVNIVAGMGTIGYLKEGGFSIGWTAPGYGIGTLFLARGVQRAVIAVTGHDPFDRLHRYCGDTLIEHLLFTAKNSPLRRVMDGGAEIIASLTLQHAAWPFVSKTFVSGQENYSCTPGPMQDDWLREHHKLYKRHDASTTVEDIRDKLKEMCDTRQSATPHLITSSVVCVPMGDKMQCALLGNSCTLSDCLRRKTWNAAIAESVEKQDAIDSVFSCEGGYCIFTNFEREYALTSYTSRPFLLSKPFGSYEKVEVEKTSIAAVLSDKDHWFPFLDRHIAELFSRSLLEGNSFFSVNSVSHLMFSHGLITVGRGLGDVYRTVKRIFTLIAKLKTEFVETEDDVEEILQKPIRKVPPAAPNAVPSSQNSASSSMPTRENAPLPKPKQKVKKRGVPSAAAAAVAPTVPANQPTAPTEVPEAFEELMEHRLHVLSQPQYDEIIAELQGLGVTVNPTTRGGIQLRFGSFIRGFHRPHNPGQGAHTMRGHVLANLRDMVRVATAAASGQSATP